MGMCFALKVTRPLISFTFIMSANSTLLQTAATLADTNPLASQFIVNLTNAELVSEMVDVIDAYDQAVLDAYDQVVLDSFDEVFTELFDV
jgi:hypothetical protein